MCRVDAHNHADAFRHEAFFYAGRDEFVQGTAAFIRDAVAADEPVLTVVSAEKIELLRAELDGQTGDQVFFADMADVGKNPARIIPAWRTFVDERSSGGGRIRGIGEPISAERSPAALVECQRHESLLNLAFAGADGFWLLCPYDTRALAPEVIDEAVRSHPYVTDGGVPSQSVDYRGLDAVAAPFDAPLPEPAAEPSELAFEHEMMGELRAFVAPAAVDAGFSHSRTHDLLLAVHEVAANSVRHGGGRGLLRVWREDGAVICEVRDAGRIDQPLVGREQPDLGQPGGMGLWLVNQLCELVQVRSFPTGSVVRLHMHD